MGRCVLLLCAWCLLSKVKVLRFNYQKMFAVGSVPWKAHQGQGCRCPPCSWAGGHSCPGADTTQGTCTRVGWATGHWAAGFPSGGGTKSWLLLCHPITSLVVSGTPVVDWCRRQDWQETAFLSLLGRIFPQPLPWTMSPRHWTTGRGVGHGGAVRVPHP